jgi:hypothetical protein
MEGMTTAKDPIEYHYSAASMNQWNTNGRNEYSKGSNGIPLIS